MNKQPLKDLVYNYLAETSEYVSGQTLAKNLGVSRTAIWKAIQALQESGVGIVAIRNKGYMLCPPCDYLTQAGICRYLPASLHKKIHLNVVDTTDSTNEALKRAEGSHKAKYEILVASEQTAGKGRRGKTFYSPKGSGVYISILIHPQKNLEEITTITAQSAVAVCRAIEACCKTETGIKWVNDIYIENKKVCGILTEATADLESGHVDFAVVGIGINVYQPKNGYPANLRKRAGYLQENQEPNFKNKLVAAVIKEFEHLYISKSKDWITEYQSKSVLDNCKVVIEEEGQQPVHARAIGINNDLSLRVQYADKSFANIYTGNISITLDE